MKRSTHSASYEYRYGGMLYEVLTDFPGESDIRFQYRGERKRHSSSAPGMPGARMDWDAGWNMVSWRAESGGAVLNEMIADPYSPVNAPAYDKHGGIHFSDQIGTTRALMTEPGSLARARDYAPYGEALADSGGSSDSFYRFGGKIHHPNIGKSYFPYRYYSPAQARWTMRDPLGMIDGPNAFAYVGGNPVNRVDPLGLSFWDEVIGGACIAACLALLLPMCAGLGPIAGAICAGLAGGICAGICYCVRNPSECLPTFPEDCELPELPWPEGVPVFPPIYYG